MTKIDSNESKSCSTSRKNRRLCNNCHHVTTTVSLDAFSFPSDGENLECVKTSPNLISSDINSQKSDVSSEIDATRRERIDRYKEERRLALRERFKTSESVPYDDDITKRLRAKSLKSPDECTDKNNDVSIKPKRLVKISTYDKRDIQSSDSGQKEWYTRSLERNKCAKIETKGLVASRVNQLIGFTSSDGIDNQNVFKRILDKPTSKYVFFIY